MKRKVQLLLLGLSQLIFVSSFAQVSLVNMSLVEPDTNILYIGLPNLIKVNGVPDNETLTAVARYSGVISKTSNSFNISAKSVPSDTLRIYLKDQLLIKKTYQVKTIPDPKIQVGKIEFSEASIHEYYQILLYI